MKKLFHICNLTSIVILMLFASSCEKIFQEIQLEISDESPDYENESPKQEIIKLPATATNYIETVVDKNPAPYIASFDGSGGSKIFICGNNDTMIGKPSDGKFNQNYDCMLSLDPHELLANSGDIIFLDYNPDGFVADAIFTTQDGDSITIKGSQHRASIKLPENLPDEYIINGEASYIENNIEYVAKGYVKILSEENMIRKNIKYKDISIFEDCYFEIPYGEGLNWSSSDNTVAKVEGNIVTGLSQGTVTISAKEHTFKVTVMGTTSSALKNTFIEPCIDWGCNGETVKSYMSSYSYKSPFEADLGDGSIIRYNENPNSIFMYSFNKNALYISYLEFKWDNDYDMEEFLRKKYFYLTTDDTGMRAYFTRDFKTLVGVSLKEDTYLIVYTPATSDRIKDMERIKENRNKIFEIKSKLKK